jgi:hypothetical protein
MSGDIALVPKKEEIQKYAVSFTGYSGGEAFGATVNLHTHPRQCCGLRSVQ